MLILAVIGQITILSTAPPLSPEDAIRTLLASHSDRNRTGAFPLSMIDDRPIVVVVRRTPDDDRRPQPGAVVPLVSLPAQYLPPAPLTRTVPGITYRLPRGWNRERGQRTQRRESRSPRARP